MDKHLTNKVRLSKVEQIIVEVIIRKDLKELVRTSMEDRPTTDIDQKT
jgi:hypothetical protein